MSLIRSSELPPDVPTNQTIVHIVECRNTRFSSAGQKEELLSATRRRLQRKCSRHETDIFSNTGADGRCDQQQIPPSRSALSSNSEANAFGLELAR